jgi:hypothetical protein
VREKRLFAADQRRPRRRPPRNPGLAINLLLNPFTQLLHGVFCAPSLVSEAEFDLFMRDHYLQEIPDAGHRRSAGSVLARIYHDIGLAAVADALRLPADGFEPEMVESLERGEVYLIPAARAPAYAGTEA